MKTDEAYADALACPTYRHEQYKQDHGTFLLHTTGWREWQDSVYRYVMGACLHCGGNFSMTVGSVLAARAMKGRKQG